MLILGLETTATAASCALCRDGEMLAMSYQRSKLTHSSTLLPMVEEMLDHAQLTVRDVDAVAVAQGPGSFTGVRIGVATVKGLCWGAEKKAIGVSTLEAMMCSALFAAEGSVICPVMDARRAQVYGAVFDADGSRLSEDAAIAADELAAQVKAMGRSALVLGDGWAVFEKALRELAVPHRIMPEPLRYQNAWGVCLAAMDKEPRGADELLPVYLRLSQAERERQEKNH